MNVFSFFRPIVLYKTTSQFNGEIAVVERFRKREIVIGALQQTGELVEELWEKALEKVKQNNPYIKSVLILGLGGGSVLKVINKLFSPDKITGVEIDPKIVEIGKLYFGLGEHDNLAIVKNDAFRYIDSCTGTYDLILVDMFKGKEIPANAIIKQAFMKKLINIITPDGIVVFNCLRGKDKECKLREFESKLRGVYTSVQIVKPLVNKLFICC